MGILQSAQDSWNSAKQAVNATVDKWAVQPNMGSTRGEAITTSQSSGCNTSAAAKAWALPVSLSGMSVEP